MWNIRTGITAKKYAIFPYVLCELIPKPADQQHVTSDRYVN